MGMLMLFRNQGLFGAAGVEESTLVVFKDYFIVVITLICNSAKRLLQYSAPSFGECPDIRHCRFAARLISSPEQQLLSDFPQKLNVF